MKLRGYMIKLFNVAMSSNAINEAAKTLNSGMITQGPKVDEFEKNLSGYFEHNRIVTVNSCTSAIHLALAVLKDRHKLKEIEVLSTPVTCAATNMPIVQNGFKIKWCDIDQKTLNIDLNDVYKKLTKDTRILMVVDWGGYPLDYDELYDIRHFYKNKFGEELFIIEDAAHAFGSQWYDLKVGTCPWIFTCFSFQAIKHLTTGDGGLLIPPDQYLKQCRLMRWFGLDRDNKVDFRCCQDIEHAGFKFHMNDINASIGIENLKNVFGLIKLCQINSKHLRESIKNPNIEQLEYESHVQSSCWLHTILVDNMQDFILYMKENNIETNPVHTRNDKFSCFHKYKTTLQNLNNITNRWICIPNGWWLTSSDIEYIIDKINKY